jgi:hypothetical protein
MSASFFRKSLFHTLPIFLFVSLSTGCANNDPGNGATLDDKPVSLAFGVIDECVWTSQDSRRLPVEGCI